VKDQAINYTVMLGAFIEMDEDNQFCRETGKPCVSDQYCEHDDADKFHVWLRRDYLNAGLSKADSHPAYNADFTTLVGARVYARALAEQFEAEIDEY